MMLIKFVAQSGMCSRRKAGDLIKNGEITVNNIVITVPYHIVLPDDIVQHNTIILSIENKLYFLYNKPQGVVCTMDDPQGRINIHDIFEEHYKERVYPVGRLDRETTGLLVITNDGNLAQKLAHPKFNIKKIYHVTTLTAVYPDDFQKLYNGIHLEDGFMKVDKISYLYSDSSYDILVTIHSGRKRIVRRLFQAVGYKVMHLDRINFGGLTKKDLPVGAWRELTHEEITNLTAGKDI